MDLLKSIDQSITDIDVSKGIITGYFSSFDFKDNDGDIIRKGAWQKTIAENGPTGTQRIRHLLDHDKTKSVAEPQSLEEDHFGLRYVSKAGRHTNGRDFLLMCEDKLIKEHSFRGKAVKQSFSKADNSNIITEVFMWEGSSMQAWGANQWTPLVSVKSLSDLQETFEVLVKAFKTGKYSDEKFMELEPLYKELGEFFKSTPEPGKSTQQPEDKNKPTFSYSEIFQKSLHHNV
ncbi:MAG: HK97 family phage prohead protease [Dyadobacter sp.]|uniref:HK97 family phage prohead protease n=1 Tax=Dyadobacter sp. TaxID=1914288 RepID=UPI001B1E5D79|nr:HK97 family phage prohead protease [Dyadobacter sp.]MBO9611053.1 HK97 family phage prohead protease [Dyadobacter sp.]